MPEKASSWAVYDPFQTADGKTVFVGIITLALPASGAREYRRGLG